MASLAAALLSGGCDRDQVGGLRQLQGPVGIKVTGVPTQGMLGVAFASQSSPVIDYVLFGSPARLAGITAGDDILSINGTPVSSPTNVQSIMESTKPGDIVRIILIRKSNPITVDVKLMSYQEWLDLKLSPEAAMEDRKRQETSK